MLLRWNNKFYLWHIWETSNLIIVSYIKNLLSKGDNSDKLKICNTTKICNAVKYVVNAKYLRLSGDWETCTFPFLIVKGR